MHINLYNKRTRNRIAREQRKRLDAMPKITCGTIMRKTLIVKSWDGHELDRTTVTAPENEIGRAYLDAYGAAIERFPRAYFFCDHSEGVIVQ